MKMAPTGILPRTFATPYPHARVRVLVQRVAFAVALMTREISSPTAADDIVLAV